MEKNILTFDVEDNFTQEELQRPDDWGIYEGQVVENTYRILSVLRRYKAGATFFIVGLVAERHPEIINTILADNHDIASHSYSHRPLVTMKTHEIEKDISKSQELFSSIAGRPVLGYRAMGFSIPCDSDNFYGMLRRWGYKYDSSRKSSASVKGKTILERDGFYEIYPSVISIMGKEILFSGGTYFRLMPMKLIKKGIDTYRKRSEPVMLYAHPWEFNKDQPRRKVSLKQSLLQSPITYSTERKLAMLLSENRFVSIENYLGLKS